MLNFLKSKTLLLLSTIFLVILLFSQLSAADQSTNSKKIDLTKEIEELERQFEQQMKYYQQSPEKSVYRIRYDTIEISGFSTAQTVNDFKSKLERECLPLPNNLKKTYYKNRFLVAFSHEGKFKEFQFLGDSNNPSLDKYFASCIKSVFPIKALPPKAKEIAHTYELIRTITFEPGSNP